MASTQTLAAVGPRTQTWPSAIVRVQMTLGPQVAAQATQICMTPMTASLSKTNTALGVSQTAGHCMALGSNRSHRHHQSRAPITARPRTQMWYPAAARSRRHRGHSIGLLVSSDSAGLLDQLVPVGAQPSGTGMVIGGGPDSGHPQDPQWYRSHKHQHKSPWLQQGHGLRHGPHQQPRPRHHITIAMGGKQAIYDLRFLTALTSSDLSLPAR